MSCGRKIGPYDCCSVVQGDCLELMRELPNGCVDAVITDPPYGVTRNDWDVANWSWPQVMGLKPRTVAMTAQQPFTSWLIQSNLQWFKWADVWHKTQARGHLNASVMPLREHEDIIVFAPNRATYNPQFSRKPAFNIRPNAARTQRTENYGEHGLVSERSIPLDMSYPRSVVTFENSQDGYHPTQKPLSLFSYLIASYSDEGDTALDPYAGSGTTLIAAAKLGRHFLGFEISSEYCAIARARIAAVEAQPTLFQSPAEQLLLEALH